MAQGARPDGKRVVLALRTRQRQDLCAGRHLPRHLNHDHATKRWRTGPERGTEGRLHKQIHRNKPPGSGLADRPVMAQQQCRRLRRNLRLARGTDALLQHIQLQRADTCPLRHLRQPLLGQVFGTDRAARRIHVPHHDFHRQECRWHADPRGLGRLQAVVLPTLSQRVPRLHADRARRVPAQLHPACKPPSRITRTPPTSPSATRP